MSLEPLGTSSPIVGRDARIAALTLLLAALLPACALMQQTARTATARAECQKQQEPDSDSTYTGGTTTSKIICEGGQPSP